MDNAAGSVWAAERDAIDAALVAVSERYRDSLASPVDGAVRYALSGGGKRIRGLLVMHAYRACGGSGDVAPLAAAIEIVHAYSLVHDDLPCMDDDDVRRGRPTVHRAFDVQTATVAGVAMVPLAVVAALDGARSLSLAAAPTAAIVRMLMRASGAGGMIGGQLLDLFGEGRVLAVEDLEHVHGGKTGALIAASAAIGGLAAGAPEARIDALERFGRAIGLAFQITDDILDVTQTTAVLGKSAGRDAALSKSTYVSRLGVVGARDRAGALVREGCAALADVDLLTEDLAALANLVSRRSS